MDSSGVQRPDTIPSEAGSRRRLALLDILYLLVLLGLYCFSLCCPLGGLGIGIALLIGGTTDDTRRVGRICLILGIVNLVLSLLLLAVLAAAGDLLFRLPFLYREGL